jgi:hypothetical protein
MLSRKARGPRGCPVVGAGVALAHVASGKETAMLRLSGGLLVAALVLAGCAASEKDDRLDDTYRFAVHALRDVGRNPIAAGAYQSAIESGATPVDYVIIGMPENANFVPLVWQGPATPWCVVIKDGPGSDDFVVEAYGDEVGTPVQSETVDLAFKGRQR